MAVTVPLCAPVGIVKLGTLSTAGLLLAIETRAPLPCAPVVRDTVVTSELPPTSDAAAGVTTASVGSGGGGGGVPFSASLVMKASPKKTSRLPLNIRSNAPAVVGKSDDMVSPVTYTLPAESSARSVP